MQNTTTIGNKKAYEMLEAAIAQLAPIVFEPPGFDDWELFYTEAFYLPRIFSGNWSADIPVTGAYVGISHYYGCDLKIARHPQNNVQLAVEIDFTSQEAVSQAVQALWEQEETWFFTNQHEVRREAWGEGGNEWWDEIHQSREFPIQVETTWEKLCAFSRAFTNDIRDKNPNENYVYQDNGGSRGAWYYRWYCRDVSQEQIVMGLQPQTPVPGEAIEHHFGQWNPYQKPRLNESLVFAWRSCSGNTLVAFCDDSVRCYISTAECNYAKFFDLGVGTQVDDPQYPQ